MKLISSASAFHFSYEMLPLQRVDQPGPELRITERAGARPVIHQPGQRSVTMLVDMLGLTDIPCDQKLFLQPCDHPFARLSQLGFARYGYDAAELCQVKLNNLASRLHFLQSGMSVFRSWLFAGMVDVSLGTAENRCNSGRQLASPASKAPLAEGP